MTHRNYRRFKRKREGKIKMGDLEYDGYITPWMSACIGIAILLLAVAPLTYIILRWG